VVPVRAELDERFRLQLDRLLASLPSPANALEQA
jgi:hypothetical protein